MEQLLGINIKVCQNKMQHFEAIYLQVENFIQFSVLLVSLQESQSKTHTLFFLIVDLAARKQMSMLFQLPG